MKLNMSSLSFKANNSRVESIKKKFECSAFSEESKLAPSKIATAAAFNNLNLSSRSSKTNTSLKSDSAKTDSNRIDGKAQIKRTPAFRREKNGSQKNVCKMELSENEVPAVDLILDKSTAKREFKPDCVQERVEPSTDNKFDRIQRSKTELLRYTNKSNSNVNCTKSTLISKRVNLLGDTQNKVGQEIFSYAVVDKNCKKKSTEKKTKETDLKLSESLRIALQSPLPKGPPPKKPPRTFCHVSSSANLNGDSDLTTAEMQRELPELKSKLQKLENVIKTHGRSLNASTMNDDFKANSEEKFIKIPKTSESRSLMHALKTKNENQISVQLSSFTNRHADDLLNEKFKQKSACNLNVTRAESERAEQMENENSKTCLSDCALMKRNVPEHIYDLPCITKSLPAMHKKFNELNKSEEGLHYLCTDLASKLSHRNPSSNEHLKQIACTDNFKSDENFAPICQRTDLNSISNDMEQMLNIEKVSGSHWKMEGKESRLEESSPKSDSDSWSMDSEWDRKSSANSFDCRPKGRNETNESENSIDDLPGGKEISSRRKVRVSRFSPGSLFNCVPYWKRSKEINCSHLFECCLLVGLTLESNNQNVAYIKKIFPPDVKPPPLIEALCFPDASNWASSMENESEDQFYSLVITNENGERKFGYCRRVLPEGSNVCLPLTYCIVTPHRAGGFFYKVLEELESKHGSIEIENFIRQLYEAEFPGPGEGLKLKQILVDANRNSFAGKDDFAASTIVRRPCDVRLEEKNLTLLFSHLQLSVFFKVFSSLLRERKILLLSNSLRKLSSCIEALQSTLLPFSWQHTYIPALPVQLLETCEAPTPYVIGLIKTKNLDNFLPNIFFENGIMVDLDDSKILKSCGDEGEILPQRLLKTLKSTLGLAIKSTNLSDANRNVLISDAFMGFFVETCGHYSKFISVSDGQNIFEEKEFIKWITSTSTQSFLEWFTKTAMFRAFMHERLHGISEDIPGKLFSLRAMECPAEALKNHSATTLPINYKVLNKKVKSLSEKIKDLVQ